MSDHIPDVTKMISDTPRTNLEAFFPHDSMYKVCDADFCRELERELNAANRRIKRLEDAGDDLHDGWRGNRNNKDKYLWAWHKAKGAKP